MGVQVVFMCESDYSVMRRGRLQRESLKIQHSFNAPSMAVRVAIHHNGPHTRRRRIEDRCRPEHKDSNTKRRLTMQLHSTAENIQLSARSRFLRRMIPVAIA